MKALKVTMKDGSVLYFAARDEQDVVAAELVNLDDVPSVDTIFENEARTVTRRK